MFFSLPAQVGFLRSFVVGEGLAGALYLVVHRVALLDKPGDLLVHLRFELFQPVADVFSRQLFLASLQRGAQFVAREQRPQERPQLLLEAFQVAQQAFHAGSESAQFLRFFGGYHAVLEEFLDLAPFGVGHRGPGQLRHDVAVRQRVDEFGVLEGPLEVLLKHERVRLQVVLAPVPVGDDLHIAVDDVHEPFERVPLPAPDTFLLHRLDL